MAKKEKVEALVDGGKASAAPPLGPALGPMGVNIGQVIAEINKKTDAFKGMKVPVTVLIDKETKEFSIEIGTPPTSQLIKKEINLQTASGMPNVQKMGNMSIQQAIKVAKMKQDSMQATSLKSAVKSVIGSANSLGVLVEGMSGREACTAIEEGKFEKEVKAGETETPKEKLAELKSQLEAIQKDFAKELDRRKAVAAAAKEEKPKEGEAGKEAAPAAAGAKPAAGAKAAPAEKKAGKK